MENQCSVCNSGYFIPDDDDIKQKCSKCSDENCKTCSGTISNNKCSECETSFYLENNKCKKDCEQGSGEKCVTCDKANHQCQSCNEGYFLPDDDKEKIKCYKCSVENCQICKGNKESNICILVSSFLVLFTL